MTYRPILNSEIASGQPQTSSLFTRLRDNPLALISAVPTELVGASNVSPGPQTGNYSVDAGVTLLMVICVGGGGGGERNVNGGGGGSSGCVRCGFVTTTGSGSETINYTLGGCGTAGSGGGDTIFGGSVTGKGGAAGGSKIVNQGAVNLGGVSGQPGEQRMVTGGTGGTGAGASGAGGAGAGVPWFLRTSSLGNGGNGGGGHATGYGAGGGGGVTTRGNGTSGIIFVLPLQA